MQCFAFRTYVVVAGRSIEPGAPFKVVVTLFLSGIDSHSSRHQSDMSDHYGFNLPSTVHAKILRRGTVIASETRECQLGSTEIISIKVTWIFINRLEHWGGSS